MVTALTSAFLMCMSIQLNHRLLPTASFTMTLVGAMPAAAPTLFWIAAAVPAMSVSSPLRTNTCAKARGSVRPITGWGGGMPFVLRQHGSHGAAAQQSSERWCKQVPRAPTH